MGGWGVWYEDDDGDNEKGLAPGNTSEERGKDFENSVIEWWVEPMEGGSRALELGEILVGWAGRGRRREEWAEACLGPRYQCAGIGLLLKIIYQHVSAFDVMDMAVFD